MLENLNFTSESLPILTAAIVQILKQLPFIKDRTELLPFVSLAVGVGLAYAASLSNPIMAGIMIGLMASGGYNVLRTKISGKSGNSP